MGTSRWLVPAVVVITGAALGTGLVVRELYQRPPEAKGSPVVQSSPSQPAANLPGDDEVRLSVDAFAHPDSQRVQALLQHYFDAINEHDYDKWRAAVTKERRNGTTRDAFVKGYATTRDGSIVVQRIESEPAADRLRVLMNLVSTQDLPNAPSDFQEGCIRWRVVYPLLWEDGELRLDQGLETGQPQRERC